MKYPVYYLVHKVLDEFVKCYKVGRGKYVPCSSFSSSRIRNLTFFNYHYCVKSYQFKIFKSLNSAKKAMRKRINNKIKKLQEQRKKWE